MLTKKLFEQLSKVIDLPDKCRSLVLRMSVDEIPVLETTRLILDDEGDPDLVSERFTLCQIVDEEASPNTPSV